MTNLSKNIVYFLWKKKERKKERYEEDKAKEVTLTEWMRLAKPQSN